MSRILHDFVRKRLKARLEKKLIRATACTIQAGPFQGMRYLDRAFCSQLMPKLLGCYEKELLPVLAEFGALSCRCVIDVGAAEGYYAVGLLYANLAANVCAFEVDGDCRELIGRLAAQNRIAADRLTVRQQCNEVELRRAIREFAADCVIVDAEGYEAILLDPLRIPELSEVCILAEVHDCILPGLGGVLARRMAPTHDIVHIDAAPRSAADFDSRRFLGKAPPAIARLAAGEERPPGMYWLWMKPRRPGRGAGT